MAKNSLMVNGKGGVIAEPIAPFGADALLITQGQTAPTKAENHVPQPVATAQGDIIPARGVVVTG